MPATERIKSIDILKGIAILGVLLIHSEALGPQPFFKFVVNHAVPVFVILFGVNSSFWWRRRALPADLGPWFRTRVRRIMLPLWAVVPLWWMIARWYRPYGVFFPRWLPLAHLLGYTVYIGTGWFVTLVIQLVVLFPVLEAARRRIGLGWLAVVSTLVAVGVTAGRMSIVDRMPETWLGFPFFNFMILAPRFLVHVAFGMWLAGRLDRLRPHQGLLAAGVWLLCVWPLYQGLDGEAAVYLDNLLDLPLTVALLVLVAPLAAVPGLARALAWLGESSYGIYVGQMLTHNAFVFHFGMFELFQRVNQWLYTGVLLAGGVLAVLVGEALLASTRRLRRAGLPVPDLAR